jgi:hypothetical protein
MATPPGQSAILSGGYSPWQAPLAALFSGISAAGQPGGWSNFGQGVTQGAQNFQQGQQNQQMMDLRRMQMEQAADEQRRANQEREQEQARLDLIRQTLAGAPGSPTQVGGPGGIQTASGGQGQSAILSGMDPQQAAFFSQYAQVDPEKAFQMLAENTFKEPDTAAPTVKDFYEGGNIVQKEWDPNTRSWLKVGEGARWQPESNKDGLWEPYTDPNTGMTGQRNTRTHKVDWDPGQTGGIQVDTNGDGTPDITVGGKGMAAPTATAGSANVRALLINQGLEDLGKVDFTKVSPSKMAAGDYANSKGAAGEFVSGLVLNDDEKRLMGAQGAIQEAVISAITGAAYSDEQKRNMRAKYVVQPTDSAARRAEKLKASAEFLAQLDRNSGNSRIPTENGGGGGAVEWERGPDGKPRKKVAAP